MLIEFEGKQPQLGENVYIEDTAQVLGNVEIGDHSSVWFHSVIRGDVHFIKIGARTNIQDLAMIHVMKDKYPTIIGDEVSIAHKVTLHGCTLHDRCLIGIGAIVLDEAVIESNCLIAAGSLVPPRFKSTPGTLIMGTPAKTVRDLRDSEREMILTTANNYVNYSQRHLSSRKNIS